MTMQNKWTMGPKRDCSKQTARKLNQDAIRFRRQEEDKKMAQKRDVKKNSKAK
jgi:hypothetical protein